MAKINARDTAEPAETEEGGEHSCDRLHPGLRQPVATEGSPAPSAHGLRHWAPSLAVSRALTADGSPSMPLALLLLPLTLPLPTPADQFPLSRSWHLRAMAPSATQDQEAIVPLFQVLNMEPAFA